MKFKYIVLGYIIAGSVATSCTKTDLFKAPQNAIPADQAYNTPARIELASVGMYDALQNANFFGGRVLIYADIRGLDAIPNSYFGQMGFYSSTNSSDGTVATAYQGAYRTIYQANLFLQGFTPKASLVTQAKADQYVGEAKFIRSLCYFYLVNLWAQPYNFTADASHLGVPIVLTPAVDPFATSNNLPRSTVKQVYDQMESDLLDAEAKLPLSVSDAFTNVARATKGAARGLLMRLYLYKGDWAKANQYADAIIGSNLYALNPSPITTFRPSFTTKESIFSVAMSGADNPNTNNSLGQHYGPRARGDIAISLDYINLMDTTVDLRYRAKGADSLVERFGGAYWTKKYAGLTTDFVPVLRYAEVILTKAEALAKLATGVDANAVTLLNSIRARSNAAPVAPVSQQDLINALIKERRIELAFEGQGSLEFQRNKLDLPAHSTVSLQAWGSNYRVLPIPKYETDKDPNLKQNDGY
ncbi:MAG TPA: RagB/SusD family nutrient uptake outer membrane protein [Puia sp.]|nr:RagB/SusD family nutrient uptake outer membrane protein [Puia sp.]